VGNLSGMAEHDIRRLGTGDLDEAVDVLVAAFRQDPLVQALFPDPGDRRRATPNLFRAILAPDARLGRVWGAGAPLQGVAVWHLPGERSRTWQGTLEAVGGQIRLLPWAVRLAQGWEVQASVERLQKAGGARERAHLYFLGVRPEAQGRGIGSSLVRPVLVTHPRAWTETQNPRNVALYEHLGFRVFATEEAPRLGVRVWALQRD
jgi:ribosomal protein S18 acetylase RimI-like enzyme